MTPPALFSTRSLARLVILFALFVFSILPNASAEAVKGSARVLRTEGAGISLFIGGTKTILKVGTILKEGSKIITLAGSSVDLLFENGVVVQIQPFTDFSIDKFLVDPFNASEVDYKNLTAEPSTSETDLKLVTGSVLTSSKKLQECSSFEIVTPLGICGIRGTIFTVQVRKIQGKPTALVGVTEGLVEFSTPKGEKREVAAGETLGVAAGATGDVFTPNPPESVKLLPPVENIDSKLRQAVPEKSFEASQVSSPGISDISSGQLVNLETVMVSVKGGRLPKESLVQDRSVENFEIGKNEVTRAEWRRVRDWATGKGYEFENPGFGYGEDHPVVSVSWNDAVKWCNAKSEMEMKEPVYRQNGKVLKTGKVATTGPNALKIKRGARGYRLPTEAEWEWAARGGKESKGYTYAGSNDLNAVGWFKDNCEGSTKPVGLKQPNEIGIYDMSGNAWEWCWDQAKNGSDRILRGGCWKREPEVNTLASGSGAKADVKYITFGFRLARDAGL